MIYKRIGSLATVISIFAVFVSVPSYADDNDKYDVAGLRLGMTYEQVKQALVDHGIAESAIQERRQSYHYGDGIKNDYRTDDFLYRITAGKKIHGNESEESFVIYFSPPPEGGSVVAVSRHVNNRVDPPTNKQYRDAVHEKYGPPTTPNKDGSINHWRFGEGEMNCLGSGGGVEIPVNSRGNNTILQQVFHTTGSSILTDSFRNGRVKNLQECASMLQYNINGYSLGENRPATSVRAVMIDVQSWVRAELAAGEMVDQLRNEVTKKRESGGAKPIL